MKTLLLKRVADLEAEVEALRDVLAYATLRMLEAEAEVDRYRTAELQLSLEWAARSGGGVGRA
tara:strand:- start:7974 stop:8162 length:189 start_codon:yes stop_codon:yes gene_type:complete